MIGRLLGFAVFALCVVWVPCAAAADVPVGCNPAPSAMTSLEPNLAVFRSQLLAYRCASYDREIEIILQEALIWVQQRASQVSRPAIVLDIDETSLSNWPHMYYNDGYPYLPSDACDFTLRIEACGDMDWKWSALAPAIQPVLDLYRLAQCINAVAACTKVEVFFITGRREGAKWCPDRVCKNGDMSQARTPTEWTLQNLQNAGFVGATEDHLFMRPKDSTGLVSAFKTAKRIEVEGRGNTIIANVGDQESDLAGLHAERTFKLPNPFYYIPQ